MLCGLWGCSSGSGVLRGTATLWVFRDDRRMDPADVDLIIANPPNPGRNHTTLVIGHAATYDTADDWPFDDTHDPAIIKTADTALSAGKDLPGKQDAAVLLPLRARRHRTRGTS